MSTKEYHIQLSAEDVGKYAIIPGDPKRVEKIAHFLEKPYGIGTNRGYTTQGGYLEGEKVTVISSGIGGPTTAIAVEELYKIGVRTMIRVGTCGGMQSYIPNGAVVIPSGVVRGGRTGEDYVPPEYPAVPHPEVLYALMQSAQRLNSPHFVGITHCKDAFFKEEPDLMPNSEGIKNYWKVLRKANVLCSEMESDTLFVISSIRGIRAGAVFAVIGSVEGASIGMIAGIEAAIQVAVEALRSIIRKDIQSQTTTEVKPITIHKKKKVLRQ